MSHFDAIVIGSGQAANPLSQKLADDGWTVALIEQAHLGGTCVNTGCTPTKTMIASAQVAHYARQAAKWGVHTAVVTVNLAEIVARKNQVVSQWRSGQERKVQQRKSLHLYRGHARFLDPHRVGVGDQVLESERIFINTVSITWTMQASWSCVSFPTICSSWGADISAWSSAKCSAASAAA
jgi:pyruvate/2-oxoglutarate dehydrogenase complex dihydrolipoamide dehydrogenase (E3) component